MLRSKGLNVEFRSWPIDHSTCYSIIVSLLMIKRSYLIIIINTRWKKGRWKSAEFVVTAFPSHYQKLGSLGYIFVADSMGLSSFKPSWWAVKTHVFWNRVRNGRSRSSKVADFGTNRNRVCDFLLVINSNLGPILLRFRDYAGFLLKTAPHPY